MNYQPAKLAAIEGRWETASPAPLTIFAIPEEARQRNADALEIPYLGSLILTHSLHGVVQGLEDFPADQRPPVWPVFFAFRVMVGIGFAMLGVVALGWWLYWRDGNFTAAWFLRLCQAMAPLGFVAVLAGWTVTEVGRQPWTVYGLLRTASSVSPSLTGPDVMGSLLAYMAVYLTMYPAGVAVMARMVRQGCAAVEAPSADRQRGAAGTLHHNPGGVRAWATELSTWCRSGPRSSRSASSCTCCWTASISAWASFGASLRRRAGPGDEHDHPGLGRQRDLADPRWTGAAGSVSPGLRHHHPGGLLPRAADAAGAGVPRRRLRVPVQPTLAGAVLVPRLLLSALRSQPLHRAPSLAASSRASPLQGRAFAGTSWDWLTPFSVLTGVALVFGYALLGAGWLVIKTDGELQAWARRVGRSCLIGVLLAIIVVSIWTPVADADIARRWFSWPDAVLLAPVPILTAAIAYAAWRALSGWGGDAALFTAAMGLFLMSYLGIAISLWPMIVPGHYTLWQAASSPSTQAFLLIGTLVLLPVILMYTAWSYWVFRGKVRGAAYDYGGR